MNDYIDRLKIKLIAAVDLDQKKINKVTDIKEAVRELESFPMTLDILNSSRIGKIVNDIRHFKDAQSDIKTGLKVLIKQWNDQLLPHRYKKSSKISKPPIANYNNKLIVSESSNSSHNNENHKEKFTSNNKFHKSSINLDVVNGTNTKIIGNCDNSFEIPNKKMRFSNKTFLDPSTTLLKEIHLASDSCQNFYKFDKSNNHKHDSPPALNFLEHKSKQVEDHSVKHRKRKYDNALNNTMPAPLQKVKSTRELLAGMGDLVGSDTKKKILCNEIAFEDDIPKSCIPESVRPKPKLTKLVKNSQSVNEASNHALNYSPKILKHVVTHDDNDTKNSLMSNLNCLSNIDSVMNTEHHVKLERTSSHGSFKDKKVMSNHISKTSPYNQSNINSPMKSEITASSVPSENHAQSVVTPALSDDLEKFSLKIKIPLNQSLKKGVHLDPPLTNRMDDLPTLPDINDLQLNLDVYNYNATNRRPISPTEDVVDLFTNYNWGGYNCTQHPVTQDLIGFSDFYIVNGLYVLAWTDKVNDCNSFFPHSTEDELALLESIIGS